MKHGWLFLFLLGIGLFLGFQELTRDASEGTVLATESIQTVPVKTPLGPGHLPFPLDDIRPPQKSEGSSREVPVANLAWVSQLREIGGQPVYYVFGMGNPSVLRLSSTEIEKARKEAVEEPGFGYVTPEAEYALERLLSNNSFQIVLSKCERQFRGDVPDLGGFLAGVYSRGYFDINQLLIIDDDGRKKIDMGRLAHVVGRLEYMASRSDPPLWKECLTEWDYRDHLLSILRNYQTLWDAYYH